MSIDKHISLFQSTRQKENAKASELIKTMLVDFKDNNFSFNYALNNIVKHFCNLETEHITSRSDLTFLLNVFKNERSNFERGMSLLVIPNILKPKFDEMEGLDISFDEYVTHLAKRISFSRARNKFQLNNRLFEAMYKIGKFDGYENLPKFDVRMFKSEPNYFELEEEIFDLVYPKKYIDDKNVAKKPKIKPFEFRREFIETMKSKQVYMKLEGDYFNDLKTNYEVYLDVFFDNPDHQSSNIHLDCETQLFARLLSEMKKHIFKSVNYKEIERNELFTTRGGITLEANNISNSAKNATTVEIEIVALTIAYIKQLSVNPKELKS